MPIMSDTRLTKCVHAIFCSDGSPPAPISERDLSTLPDDELSFDGYVAWTTGVCLGPLVGGTDQSLPIAACTSFRNISF